MMRATARIPDEPKRWTFRRPLLVLGWALGLWAFHGLVPSNPAIAQQDSPGVPSGATVEEEPDAAAIQETVERLKQTLDGAAREPDATRAFVSMLTSPPPAVVAELREFDRADVYPRGEAGAELRREIYRALARGGDFRSLHYLRETFESRPERRDFVADALTHFAARHGRKLEEWQILVRSLPFLEPATIPRVLESLATFPQKGSKPQWQREVILAALRLPPEKRQSAVLLLEYWTGRKQGGTDESPEARLIAWQSWFAEQHREIPPAELPVDRPMARHAFAELVTEVRKGWDEASSQRGQLIYERAQCGKCHQLRGRGEAMGPDLTSAAMRFDVRNLIESLLFPSQTIADDYGAVTVQLRDGRRLTGVLNAGAGKYTVLQPNSEKVVVSRKEVEEMTPSRASAMPDGLLDALSPKEITDLAAYLLDREVR